MWSPGNEKKEDLGKDVRSSEGQWYAALGCDIFFIFNPLRCFKTLWTLGPLLKGSANGVVALPD